MLKDIQTNVFRQLYDSKDILLKIQKTGGPTIKVFVIIIQNQNLNSILLILAPFWIVRQSALVCKG